MSFVKLCHITLLVVLFAGSGSAYTRSFDCGSYGFVCEGKSKLRLCEGDSLLGPAFLCPAGTICNEDSSDVCESVNNYMDPALRTVRCRRNERIADPTVPGCKGYILCIPNKNRFQGIKFKCTGDTVFNGFTRTCSSPDRYKCPLGNVTKNPTDLFVDNLRVSHLEKFGFDISPPPNTKTARPIDCKNYKLTVTQERNPTRAAYFCPPRPLSNGIPVKCTVFSNHFCIILERDDEDQFLQSSGSAFRRPRNYYP
ncbi:uncharacterized protein LOC126366391 [Pectinophora gossypiella]|uniref:uncharacterized protein LOC126366391 n=1 Tax=Pectinophora gossypiella TaxID=13191 RepID=UPI00214EED47|nr:uncharacterized protein LOC126366391 [Pectinophora gossypiella]